MKSAIAALMSTAVTATQIGTASSASALTQIETQLDAQLDA